MAKKKHAHCTHIVRESGAYLDMPELIPPAERHWQVQLIADRLSKLHNGTYRYS